MIGSLLILETILISTILYAYLRKKTRIRLKYLYIDNIAVIIPVIALAELAFLLHMHVTIIVFFLIPILTLGLAFAYTMIRFYRTPNRKVSAGDNVILSPADGNIIYIKRIEASNIPVSIKNGRSFRLNELTKTDLLLTPCWLIGINMTPFDVHKNSSPIEGKIVLNEHFNGKFLSLKDTDAVTENERNTYVIENNTLKVAVIQIASRLVRRIDVYVKKGQQVKCGEWIGMIRFGSQVDVIIPTSYEPCIIIGQQVYAATSVLGSIIS
jgi:phosphatidylserine decarboxylase